jgi:hypothetical protein
MDRQAIDIRKGARRLVVIAIVLLFLLGLLQVAQGFVDTRDYREHIVSVIKDRTGKDVAIKGKVSVSLLPIPTIFVQNVELRDEDKKSNAPTATVEMLSINASFFSLFSENPLITGISLYRPVLELQRATDGIIYWDWFNFALIKNMLAAAGSNAEISLDVVEGKVLYRNNQIEREISVTDIQLKGVVSNQPVIGGTFVHAGHALRVMLDMRNSGNAANGMTPLMLRIYADDKNQIQLLGGMDLSADAPLVDAKFTLLMEDALAWSKSKKTNDSLIDNITNESQHRPDEKQLLAVDVAADYRQADEKIVLENMRFQAPGSQAVGSLSLSWKEKMRIDVNMAFESLNYDAWSELLMTLYVQKFYVPPATRYAYDEQIPNNPIPADVSLNLDIVTKKMTFGSKVWDNALLSAKLDEAAITVNRFTIDLPGASNFTMFGVISQASIAGLRFEGSMESRGDSLRDLLSIFDESTLDLPDIGLGQYAVRSNLFISSEQVRLSEADLKIGDLQLSGGLVYYNDTNPRVEADVRLKDINFDFFRDAWRAKQDKNDKQAFFLKLDKSNNFNWLRKLRTSVDFKVIIDRFTFLERPGDKASFRLFAKDGEMGVYDVRFDYPDETMEVSFTLNINGEQPFVNVVFNSKQLDTGYFMASPGLGDAAPSAGDEAPIDQPGVKTQRWSQKLIDMGWLEGVNGVFDISVGTLLHEGLTFDQFKMRAKLEKNVMTFQALSFGYWQGKFDILGSVYGGKVPGIALSFTYFNGELYDLLSTLVGRENVSGKVSVSGTLATSGVNLLSWLSQSESKILFNARDLVVKGLNMQGVLDAVAVSRTASDVYTNVNRELLTGASEMTAEGTINIKNGAMKTPGITLRMTDIIGNLTGEVKLLSWRMDLSTFFQFTAIPSETIPTMTMQLVGPIDSPELNTDTSSLEAYVAKRIISK